MSDTEEAPSQLPIEVVYALAEKQQLVTLDVKKGTRAGDALRLVLDQKLIVLNDTDNAVSVETLPIGVYGLQVENDYVMKAGDRLEIYRPLLQDPKERRRQQAKKR